jgi:hypothetical protein
MLHRRFKLIHNPDTIFIDRERPQESDIDEEENPVSNATLKAL